MAVAKVVAMPDEKDIKPRAAPSTSRPATSWPSQVTVENQGNMTEKDVPRGRSRCRRGNDTPQKLTVKIPEIKAKEQVTVDRHRASIRPPTAKCATLKVKWAGDRREEHRQQLSRSARHLQALGAAIETQCRYSRSSPIVAMVMAVAAGVGFVLIYRRLQRYQRNQHVIMGSRGTVDIVEHVAGSTRS